MRPGSAAQRMLATLRRASNAVYRLLLFVLLSFVYVTIMPWYALALRLRRRPTGWRDRRDPDLATLERLRSPF